MPRLAVSRGVSLSPVSVASVSRLQPVTKLLAGFEEGDVFFADRDAFAGTWVARAARVALLDREHAETAQLDPVAAQQCCSDLPKNRADNNSGVPLGKMRVGLREPFDKLRSIHCGRRSQFVDPVTVPKG